MRLFADRARLLAAAVPLFGAAGAVLASGAGFVSPERGETLAPGSVVEIEWRSACESDIPPGFDEAEVVLSLDGGLSYPIRVSRELDPCESTVSWRVPALATTSGRLALRLGSETDVESEEIAVIGDPFTILPDVEGRVERLIQRSHEWATDPQPQALGAADRLSHSLRATGQNVSPSREPVVPAVAPASPSLRQERSRVHLASNPLTGLRPAASVPEAPFGAPTPLRL